jgi:predicted permease
VDKVAADTGFITAAGFRLLRGRAFTATDQVGTPPVAIVNQAFAERFWPGREAVGRQFRGADSARAFQVVGVVNTAKIRNLAEDPRPAVYFALAQSAPSAVWLIAQTSGDADQLLPRMLGAVREIDPELFVFQSRTLARHLDAMSLPIKLGALALAAFAGLALVMASIGLYGTVSYAVSQRTREVGIRLSLGADRRAVVGLLLRSGLRLVLIGVAVGLVLSLALAQLLQRLLFGVRALDPLTFVAVPLVLLAVAFVAAWIPARRAGRVDPLAALKAE